VEDLDSFQWNAFNSKESSPKSWDEEQVLFVSLGPSGGDCVRRAAIHTTRQTLLRGVNRKPLSCFTFQNALAAGHSITACAST
jgi:hypothetical protein